MKKGEYYYCETGTCTKNIYKFIEVNYDGDYRFIAVARESIFYSALHLSGYTVVRSRQHVDSHYKPFIWK